MAKPGFKPRPPADRFWEKVQKGPGCWEWAGGTTTGGYGYMTYEGRFDRAHRVSWRLNVGPIPEGMLVCHHCDNPRCVKPEHLYIGTQADNMRDLAVRRRGTAKLTDEQVRELRALRARGFTARSLARRYGVHRSTIYGALRGENYRHVA